MKAGIRIAAPLVLAAAGALAATGFGYSRHEMTTAQAPSATSATTDTAPAPMTNDGRMTTSRTDEAPVATAEMPAPAPAYRSHRRITVIAPRPSDDELLRNAVMERLNGDAGLAGRIGVEAYRHTVSLTGRVTTTGQIERAGMLARGVDGVQDVNNYLLARVGMS